jgi:hypothetical protein
MQVITHRPHHNRCARSEIPPHKGKRRSQGNALATRLSRNAWLLYLLFTAALSSPAWAATAEEEARMKQCPEGQYSGPGTGAKRFYQDPYIWFVSREFAKRYCMPESYIDESLKGALALAVRLKPEAFTLCGLFAGRSDQCPTKQELLMDVYVDNTKANIPKADPTVKFFIERPLSSGALLGPEGMRSDLRRKGEMPDVEGERRPFSPMHSKTVNEKNWTRFLYLGVRDGWATGAGGFIETYYRADWVPGVDLITLDISYQMGYQSQRNPDEQIQTERRQGRGYADEQHDRTNPIQKWAIGVIRSRDWFAVNTEERRIPYPSGYTHVIELPHRVAQIFYAYDWKQGEAFFNNARKALEPASAPQR